MKVETDERLDAKEPIVPREDESKSASRPSHPVRNFLLVLLVLGAAAAVVVSGILPRLRDRKTLQAETQQLATHTVSVIQPKHAPPAEEIVLPGNIQAYTEAPIYARTSGYLKRWYADIGAHIKAGQLLAEIDTPEIDQQLQQARADLSTANANYHLAEITNARYQDLLKTNSVAQQDADNAAGNFDAKKAALDSAQANLNRLEELQSFNKIYAPFDGVITARNTDVGALIDSGSGGGPTRELFHIAATQRLRVYVNVPQTYSAAAKPGLPAKITFAESPGRSFPGTLARTANAIDTATRTLLTEIDVDNSSGEILPGAYGQVHLKLPGVTTTFLLPVNTLLFRSKGLEVATVRGGTRVVLQEVALGRDFGTEAEVVSGLDGTESVVLNPADSLNTGDAVEVAQPSRKEGKK